MLDPRVFNAFSRLATQQPQPGRIPSNALDMQRSWWGLRALPQPQPPALPSGPMPPMPLFPNAFPPGVPAFAPVANALDATRAPTIRTFTLAQLLAGNDNAKGAAARGGVQTMPTYPPQQGPRVVDLPSVAGGTFDPGESLPEPVPNNDNHAPRWFWPFR